MQSKYSPPHKNDQPLVKVPKKYTVDDSVIEETKTILHIEIIEKDEPTAQKKNYLQ